MSKSIFKVSSNVESNKSFGTAFCVYQDETYSYLVTCKHVIESVGGGEHTLVSGKLVSETFLDIVSEADIAVLKVSDLLAYTLPSGIDCLSSSDFCTFGWYLYNDSPEIYKNEGLSGVIGKTISLQYSDTNVSVKGWNLNVDEGDFLKKGFSGSPVIDKKTRLVFAVISHLEKNGRSGTAISIQEILNACAELPKKVIREELFDLESMRKSIKGEFQGKTGYVKKEFYILLKDFGIEDNDEAFLIDVETLVNYCHFLNKSGELEKRISNFHVENRKKTKSLINFFSKKWKNYDYKYCTCRINFKTNLSLDKAGIPLQALAAELDLCYENLNIIDAKEGSLIVDFLVKRKYLKIIISLYENKDLIVRNLGIEYVQEILVDDFDYAQLEKLLFSVMSYSAVREEIYIKYSGSIEDLAGNNKVTIIKKIIGDAEKRKSLPDLLNLLQKVKPDKFERYKPYFKTPLRPNDTHVISKNNSWYKPIFIFIVATSIAFIGVLFMFLIQYYIMNMLPSLTDLTSVVWFALIPLGLKVGEYVSESLNRSKSRKAAILASASYITGYHIGIPFGMCIYIYLMLGNAGSISFASSEVSMIDFIFGFFRSSLEKLLIGMTSFKDPNYITMLLNLFLGTLCTYQKVRQG